MSKWNIKCFVWPYFPHTENQRLVGDEIQEFSVEAEDFNDAVRQGEGILSGIKSNPNVWMAGIKGVSEEETA